MNSFTQILARIDVARFAGIRRILGIDLTDDEVRLVELEKEGGWLNKFAGRFTAHNALHIEFDKSETPNERTRRVQAAIATKGFVAMHAVMSVRTAGVKQVRSVIPDEAASPGDWIRENHEKLLRFPVPIDQLAIDCEPLERSDNGTLYEITFIRKTEVASYRESCEKAGLTLLALGAGVRDVTNGIVVGLERTDAPELMVAHVGTNQLSLAKLKSGRRSAVSYHPSANSEEVSRILTEEQNRRPDSTLMLTGEIDSALQQSGFALAEPFGLRSEYALATGLAVKGFLPELSPTNFLSAKEKENVSVGVYKRITHRVTLASGSVLMFLLGTQILVGLFLQTQVDALDEELAVAWPDYAEIALLEGDVATLRRKLDGDARRGSTVARTLHDLASVVPSDVWLYKLQVTDSTGQRPAIVLRGYARSNERIPLFLKDLRRVSSEVNLIRFSLPLQSETFVPVVGGQSMMTFEIRLTGQ